MKKLSALALFLAVATPALAQNSSQQTAQNDSQSGIFTCWYSSAGKLTGAQPTNADVRVHNVVLTGRGGDQAWAYAIRSTDGHECPRLLPRS